MMQSWHNWQLEVFLFWIVATFVMWTYSGKKQRRQWVDCFAKTFKINLIYPYCKRSCRKTIQIVSHLGHTRHSSVQALISCTTASFPNKLALVFPSNIYFLFKRKYNITVHTGKRIPTLSKLTFSFLYFTCKTRLASTFLTNLLTQDVQLMTAWNRYQYLPSLQPVQHLFSGLGGSDWNANFVKPGTVFPLHILLPTLEEELSQRWAQGLLQIRGWERRCRCWCSSCRSPRASSPLPHRYIPDTPCKDYFCHNSHSNFQQHDQCSNYLMLETPHISWRLCLSRFWIHLVRIVFRHLVIPDYDSQKTWPLTEQEHGNHVQFLMVLPIMLPIMSIESLSIWWCYPSQQWPAVTTVLLETREPVHMKDPPHAPRVIITKCGNSPGKVSKPENWF